jgi:hypothetical protein
LFRRTILPLGFQYVQHRPGLLRAGAPNDAWNRPAQRMPPSVRINF